jgi:hypothetical protein
LNHAFASAAIGNYINPLAAFARQATPQSDIDVETAFDSGNLFNNLQSILVR